MSTLSSAARALWAIIKGETAEGANTAARVGAAGEKLVDAIEERVLNSEKGTAGGVATLGTDGYIPFNQIKPISSDVIELLEIASILEDVQSMVTGDKVFYTGDNKIYTYATGAWANPTTPEIDKLYLSKADTLTYKYNGTTLVATTSPLPYATLGQAKAGTSFVTVLSPYAAFESFKWWLANTVFSGLSTVSKTIQGAINELFSTRNKLDNITIDTTDSIVPDFSKDIFRTNNTGSASIQIASFTNLPSFGCEKLVKITNSRATTLTVTFRTSDLVVGDVTYTFINFSPTTLNLPVNKRVEISYLFDYITSTSCMVHIMYVIQP